MHRKSAGQIRCMCFILCHKSYTWGGQHYLFFTFPTAGGNCGQGIYFVVYSPTSHFFFLFFSSFFSLAFRVCVCLYLIWLLAQRRIAFPTFFLFPLCFWGLDLHSLWLPWAVSLRFSFLQVFYLFTSLLSPVLLYGNNLLPLATVVDSLFPSFVFIVLAGSGCPISWVQESQWLDTYRRVIGHGE